MIAFLTGTIHEKRADALVVLVSGVGYLVFVPARMLEEVHEGSHIELHTHYHIREDAVEVFGFVHADEYALFTQLIKVSGVGPKMALGIISSYTTDAIRAAIVQQDIALLTSISGIGKKTAERIVVELKDSASFLESMLARGGSQAATATSAAFGANEFGDPTAAEALMALGYTTMEVATALAKIDTTTEVQEQVRQALLVLSQQ